jgi:prolipoprotein diacylglyceryltransferase
VLRPLIAATPVPDAWIVETALGGRAFLALGVAVFAVVGAVGLVRIGIAGSRAMLVIGSALLAGGVGAWVADGVLTRDFAHFGLSLFGAALVGPFGAVAAGRRVGADAWRVLAGLSPAALLGAATARAGCLFVGCDFGTTGAPPAVAVRHVHGSAAWASHLDAGVIGAWARVSDPVHPFAVYEAVPTAIAGLVAASALGAVEPRALALRAAAAYALARAAAEVFRGDALHAGGVPVLVLGCLAIGVTCLVLAGRPRFLASRLVFPSHQVPDLARSGANPGE